MTKAAHEPSPEESREAAADDVSDDQGRASGSRPATRYEPLPIGSDAFATPLAPSTTVSDGPGPLRARAVWLIVGAAAGVASGALGLALLLKSGHAAEAPAPAPVEPAALSAVVVPTKGEAAPAESGDARHASSAEAPSPAAKPTSAAAPEGATAPQPTRAPSAADVSVQETEPKPAQSSPISHASSEHGHGRPRSHRLPEQPDRAQVIAAMAAVQPAVRACFGAARGTATANVRVLGSSGRVTTAQVTGQPGAIGSCIARAVRRARFPTFATESLTISYPFGH